MEIDLYMARRRPGRDVRVYLLMPAGKPLESVPREVKEKLGDLDFKKRTQIKSGEKRVGLEADEALRNLEDAGYHVQVVEMDQKKLEAYSNPAPFLNKKFP